MSEVARMHAGWFRVLETDTVSLIFGLLNTHTGEHRVCGNTLPPSGFTDAG